VRISDMRGGIDLVIFEWYRKPQPHRSGYASDRYAVPDILSIDRCIIHEDVRNNADRKLKPIHISRHNRDARLNKTPARQTPP
jgi:hypothetical protein